MKKFKSPAKMLDDVWQINYDKNDDPLEAVIEERAVAYAKRKYGMIGRKYATPSNRASPDRIFFTTDGRVFFIEFKRKGKTATPAQQTEHEIYRKLGFWVFVCDNIKDACDTLDLMA